jgi:hydroxymethylbilane synthase
VSGTLRIGTRGSALALAQSGHVAAAIGPGAGVELVTITTSGDEGQPGHDPKAGGDKARFTREIERALLAGEVDLAVHSAKDLPIEMPEGLTLAGVPPRELPADAWVGPGSSLEDVAEGAAVGTSSLRRRSQLLAARPDLEIRPLRGNVDTRLRKLADGECDAIVLAAAGLRRLGRGEEIAFPLGASVLTPAAGQGALALQAREGDEAALAAAAAITNPRALIELTAERAVVRGLEADCDTPVGVASVRAPGAGGEREGLTLVGYAGTLDGKLWVRESVSGDPAQPVALAESLIELLDAAGAREILRRAAVQADRERRGGPPL